MNNLLLSAVLAVTLANISSAQLLDSKEIEKETSRFRPLTHGGHVRVRPTARPNIVLILGDDMGVDLMGTYAEGAAPPCTPALDSLAANGLLFRNAWTNPVCSPTRAAIMTGRYGFRTGIGTALTGNQSGLLLSETTLPDLLVDYETACVGKWHLAGGQSDLHPNAVGFDNYAGGINGGVGDYESWNKTVNGMTASTSTYATTDTANDGIAAIHAMSEPWFLYMNFNAPHTPFHMPPSDLCPASLCANASCESLGGNPSNPDLAKAMVEALDQELARFFDALAQEDPNAIVIFMGDNGTAGQAIEAPFASNHGKGTVYEGGVNVPFIVSGPDVAVGESQALISSVDLFATIAELAGYSSAAEDSISIVPILADPQLSTRLMVFSETFTPNAPFVATRHDRAIFDGRYKLIRKLSSMDEFYDLSVDPYETNNLIPGLTGPQQQARQAMRAELVAIGVD